MERPADSAGRRALEARHLRLPVPAGVRAAAATTTRAFPDVSFSGTGAPAQLDRPVAVAAVADDRHHGRRTPDVDQATRTRCGRGVLITRNRKDQNGRFELHRRGQLQPGRQPAIRPATRSPTRCSATSAPTPKAADDPLGFFRFTQYGGFVSDNWRVQQEPEPRDRAALRVPAADLHAGQQHHELRPGALRPDAGDRCSIANGTIVAARGNPLQRPGPRPATRSRGSAGPRHDRSDGRGGADPDRRAARPLRHLAPVHAALQRRLHGERRSGCIRGGVGLFYDRPEGNVIFSQVNLPPFLPSVASRTATSRTRSPAPRRRRRCSATINALDPDLDVPRQLQVQRQRAARAAVRPLRRSRLRRQPGAQPALAAGHQPCRRSRCCRRTRLLPAAERANTNFLRPYQGYSSIRQRRSDAFSDYNGLQFYLNKRRGDIRYTVSYTLSQGDRPRQRQRRQPARRRRLTSRPTTSTSTYFVGPTTFDRRHALIITSTYTVPFFRGRGATSLGQRSSAAGRSAARSAGSRAST